MKINQLSVLFCAMLLIGAFVSCRNGEMQEAITESAEGMVFRLQKAAFSGSEMNVSSGGKYDKLYYYITDEDGNVIKNVKSYYDSEKGTVRAEGLHEGSYSLLVLGIDGDERQDRVQVNAISHVSEDWIVFPETLLQPLTAQYFYSRTPFTVEIVEGDAGKFQEIAQIPDNIVQKRIVTRIDFGFNYNSVYVANSLISKKAIVNGPRFYRTFSGDGQYSGTTDGTLTQIGLDEGNEFLFMPLVAGTDFGGEVEMLTINYLGEEIAQSYRFVLEETEATKIHLISTEVNHPDDRLATMYVTETAMEQGEFYKILEDDEPVDVYTDRQQRSFNTAEPLQVSVTEDGKLHIRFYSPRDLHNVLLKAYLPAVSDEYFDIAYFNRIPAFADFQEGMPVLERSLVIRTETGRYVEIPKLSKADLQNMVFKIESNDEYWERLGQIKHGWTLYWGLFGGDPSKEDGGPVGNWMGIRPVHCRESVAFFLNFTFMIDMPEHEQILHENADQLYDDNKELVKVDEVLAKMRRNQTLQVGLVYTGNGIIGLGSPSVFGAYQRGWFEHYFNTYACSVMFHELGHVMGYGHSSSFTYGPWAEQLMNNFYVNNLYKMPIDNIDYLQSAQNPHIYPTKPFN